MVRAYATFKHRIWLTRRIHVIHPFHVNDIMQCHTELLPPTIVTHSVALPFLDASATNLIVAKASVLQVFALKTITTDVNRSARERRASGDQHGTEGQDAVHRSEHTSRLILIGEYPLSGTVTSLARIKTLNTKSGGEALLVATRDAKVSLVDWDPANHRISTVSIHYYEGDKIQSLPFGPSLGECSSYLTVDPTSRCAALRFGIKHLAILPFRQPGDDLVDEQYDADLDPTQSSKLDTNAANQDETPYKPSFVLPLTAIDPALTHPVHMAFLHEYREPTFGIVSANKAASQGLLDERKDPLTYTVFTLDLEQRASTALLSVTGLPFDIFRVIPLPLPVGGALLVGTNQLVHVDQAGKATAVGVNEFARQCSDFSMADQSDLGLRLEGCQIEALDPTSADMLIVLKTGELAILTFRIDGRSVSALSVRLVDPAHGGRAITSPASSIAAMGRGRIFVGSEDGDSSLLGWTKKTAQLSRKRSHAQMLAEEADVELDEDDLDDADDDLYADESSSAKQTTAEMEPSVPGTYAFRVHDSLLSLGPIMNMCMGKAAPSRHSGSAPSLTLVAATGRSRSSKIALINRELTPDLDRDIDIPQVRSVWSVCAKNSAVKGLPKLQEGERKADAQTFSDDQHDQYLITSKVDDGASNSKVFRIENRTADSTHGSATTTYTEILDTEFEGEDETLDAGTLADGTRIVQVRAHEVRTYDADLGLSQIYPILDETTDEEMTVVHSSFCDPYLLVIRQDSSLQVLAVDDSGDLDEVERGIAVQEQKWLSGSLYRSAFTDDKVFAFLLDAKGGLNVFELPDLQQPVYNAPQLSFLPPVLSSDNSPRRATGKETLTDILFADLGDSISRSPYLILRSSADDLILYEPFHSLPGQTFPGSLRFRKVPGLHLPKSSDEMSEKPSPLRVLPDVGGYATVFMPGDSPSFIMKESSGLPQVVSLRGKGVKALCALDSSRGENGFAYVDESGRLREGRLPHRVRFCLNGWAVRKFSPFSPDHEIRNIAYHTESDVYVVVTQESVDFYPPEDDSRHPAADEDIALRPKTSQFHVHIYDPYADLVIHSLPLPAHEIVTSMEIMPLEVSEVIHKHKTFVAIGTISQRAENFAARGALYILDVIEVVPEPGRPQTGKKLHVHGREDTKGGITALMGIAGLVGTAQGQKMMIRGLREDGSCLPVAFLDAQCYMASLKTLGDTKLWLAADAWKGLWFGGFGIEPYKISLFGKSRSHMEVVTADFLPFEGQLYLIAIDAAMDMHVLQYDPEHPKSLSGQRLLHRSTFHLGHLPTSMTLLPSTLAPFSEQPLSNGDAEGETPAPAPLAPDLHHLLVSTQSGSISLVTPLDETTYRRLSALQTTLSSILEHPAGLNPRAYRAVESEGLGSRGVVDGDLICRVGELGAGKRAEVLGRAGAETWGIKSDLEVITGRGLGYL